MYSPSSPRDDASGSRDPSIPLTPSLPISEPYTPYDQQLAPKYSTSPMHVPYYHEDSYYSSKARNLDEEYNPHEQQSLKSNPPPPQRQPQDQEYSPSFSVPYRRYSEQSPASYFPSYQYVLSPVLPTARTGSGTRISPPLPPMALPPPRRTSGSLPPTTAQDNFARHSSDGRSRSPSSGAYGNWESSHNGKRSRQEEDEVEVSLSSFADCVSELIMESYSRHVLLIAEFWKRCVNDHGGKWKSKSFTTTIWKEYLLIQVCSY